MTSAPPMQAHGTSARARLPAVAAILLATLVGAVLRFSGLAARDFWFDESCTFIYVHNLFNWPKGSSLLVESTNLPYYVLLHGWTRVFGESEPAYRSLSSLCATLTIPVVAYAASRTWNRTAAVFCAAIIALHPLHIYYAREARAYALWILMLSICLALLIEAMRRNKSRWWAAFAGTAWACLHVHYFTIFWLPATGAAVLLAQSRSLALRRWLVTTCVVVAGFLPYLCLAALPAARAGGSSWIAQSFDPVTAVPQSLWALLPAGAYPGHLRGLSLDSPDTSVPQRPVLVVASQVIPAATVAVLGLALMRRRWSEAKNVKLAHTAQKFVASRHFERSEESPGLPGSKELEILRCAQNDDGTAGHSSAAAHLALACMTVGPLILAWAYSVLVRPVYLVGRYDLAALPAAVVWLAIAAADLAERRRSGRNLKLAALATVLLLPAVVPIHRIMAFRPPPSPHHLRAVRLAELAGPSDLVIAFSYDRDHLAYYLHRAGFAGAVRSFPGWLENQVGWVDTDADLTGARLAESGTDAQSLADEVTRRIRSRQRVFLLADSVDPQGTGPRKVIHAKLAGALTARGLKSQVVDAKLQIHELTE